VLAATAPVDESPRPPTSRTSKRPRKATLLEVLTVVLSPVVLFFVLRLRAMAPYNMPDPAMHTAYIVFPHDFFARYSSELGVIAGTREGARVGFLVPARLSFLAFGVVPGFFVFRYLLALVAVVPSYVLLRRLHGRAAGALAVVILMSSPVLITAWGTDYPDSAIVSYLTGALACLAMPCRDKRRAAWLAVAGALFTLAVWSNVEAAPLVAATMLAYLAVGVLRTPRRLLRDALVLGSTAVAVTGVLMLASGLLLGPFDYILPTLRAYRFLNRPVVILEYHSTNRRWILRRPYLLVPAAAVAAWGATFLRRLRAVPTPQLLIGSACATQIAAFSFLQFLGNAETLEQHYYSSSLWAAVSLVLAITVVELAKPLSDHPLARWTPAGLVLIVALLGELDQKPPAFGWSPTGLLIVAALILAAVIGRLVVNARSPAARAISMAVVVAVMGGSLILTVARYQTNGPLPGMVGDPVPAYATALGGSDGNLLDQYRVATELPQFVGNSTYPGERLLMWFPHVQLYHLTEVTGVYHDSFNALPSSWCSGPGCVPGSPGSLTVADRSDLEQRKPAELLVLNAQNLSATLRALAPYDPTLLRTKVLRSGDFAVNLALISLGVYMH